MDLMRRRIIMGSILAAVGSGVSSRAQVSVCPSCGREHGPGLSICPHCKGSLTAAPARAAEPATTAESPEPASPDGVTLPSAVPEAELAAARRAFEENRDWAAIRLARNSRSLSSLAKEKRAEIMQGATMLITAARKRLATGRMVCPACKGMGGKTSLASNLRGELRKVDMPNSRCDACGGEKTVPVKRGLRAHGTGRADQIRSYEAAQEGKGFARSGKLWLPGDLDLKKIPARQMAAMRRSFGLPCETCGGLGADACEECKGAGKLVCPEEECSGGRVPCPDCKGTKFKEETKEGSVRPVRVRCPTCNTLGHVQCPECGGKHFISCGECEGRGAEPCKDCKGSGTPPDCRTCKGDGYTPCRSCKGGGERKGTPCPECAGTGEQLCARCEGFGVVQK